MSDEELMRIAFAEDKTVADILMHIFNLGVEKGREDAVEWIVNNMPLDCYDCPVTECFTNKNTDCKTELLKKMKEEQKND